MSNLRFFRQRQRLMQIQNDTVGKLEAGVAPAA